MRWLTALKSPSSLQTSFFHAIKFERIHFVSVVQKQLIRVGDPRLSNAVRLFHPVTASSLRLMLSCSWLVPQPRSCSPTSSESESRTQPYQDFIKGFYHVIMTGSAAWKKHLQSPESLRRRRRANNTRLMAAMVVSSCCRSLRGARRSSQR